MCLHCCGNSRKHWRRNLNIHAGPCHATWRHVTCASSRLSFVPRNGDTLSDWGLQPRANSQEIIRRRARARIFESTIFQCWQLQEHSIPLCMYTDMSVYVNLSVCLYIYTCYILYVCVCAVCVCMYMYICSHTYIHTYRSHPLKANSLGLWPSALPVAAASASGSPPKAAPASQQPQQAPEGFRFFGSSFSHPSCPPLFS